MVVLFEILLLLAAPFVSMRYGAIPPAALRRWASSVSLLDQFQFPPAYALSGGVFDVYNQLTQLTSTAAIPGESPKAIRWAADYQKFRNDGSVVVV